VNSLNLLSSFLVLCCYVLSILHISVAYILVVSIISDSCSSRPTCSTVLPLVLPPDT
jgi:hypothetical protein